MGFYADEMDVAGGRESGAGVSGEGEGEGEGMVFVAMLAYERAFVLCRKARPRAVTASARHAESREHVNSSSANSNCGSDCSVVSDLFNMRVRENVSGSNTLTQCSFKQHRY
jgi:hypothetical protein